MPDRKLRQIEKLMEELAVEVDLRRHPVEPSRHWWMRWWRGFVAVSRRSVILTVRSAVGATFIAVVGFWALYSMTQSVADARVNDNLRSTEAATYQAAVDGYVTTVIQRSLCVDSVGASLRNRGQWEVAVNVLRDADLEDAALRLEEGPLLSAEPRTTEECPPLFAVPVDPSTGELIAVDPFTSMPVVSEEQP